MHRTIEITVPPSYTRELVDQLGKLDGVVSLSVVRGASVKPKGDVLTVYALNLGADEVSACGTLAGTSESDGHRFQKAHAEIEEGRAKRAGLLATTPSGTGEVVHGEVRRIYLFHDVG